MFRVAYVGYKLAWHGRRFDMGAIWKFFSGEDDAAPTSAQSAERTSIWGFLTGQHATGTPNERTVAAYHEAGHARGYKVAGVTVHGMSVKSDGSGETLWKPRSGMSDRQRRALLVAIIAGQEAECRYLMDRHGCSYKEALKRSHSGAEHDRKSFKQRAEGTGYTFEGLRPDAHRLVRWHAYTIETNAKPLSRHGHRGGTWV